MNAKKPSRRSRNPGDQPPRDAQRLHAMELRRQGEEAATEGRWIDALRAYDGIIGLGIADAEIWRETGDLLLTVKEYAQAISAYQHSLQHDATFSVTHHQLARALYKMGEADEAVKHVRTAIDLHDHIEHWQALATVIPNAPLATHAEVLDARRQWARRLSDGLGSRRLVCYQERIKRVDQRLRVAYLSAHFASQNYMKPVWALINHHDRQRFHVTLLSDAPMENPWSGYRSDARDERLDVSELNDGQLAKLIEERRIDLLIDLSAYSYPDRLSFFLQKAAPRTVAWFNMYATSGLDGFDVIVGDAHVVLPEEECWYTESVERLPLSYLTFQVDYEVPPVASLPCLATGQLTFGSLISQYKITPPVIRLWSEILRRSTPATRLLLANADLKSRHNQTYLADRFAEHGVAREQLVFLPPADHQRFLGYYNQIDVALDAFPYNGGTTTMEAIWQGVPVLTKEGDRWAGRTSQTLLRECHLADFVARDDEAFVEQGVAWATQPELWSELATLRSTMRTELTASSACDGGRLALEMERLFDRLVMQST